MIWKEKYRLGVPLIDEQHEELFHRVTDFVETVRRPVPWEDKNRKVNETLDFMKEYVVSHFRDEEAYQKEIGYPGLEAHRKIHGDMVRYVADVSREYEGSGDKEQLMQQFAGKLLAWLIHHVASEDQKIADFAAKKGARIVNDALYRSFLSATRDVFRLMLDLDVREDGPAGPEKEPNRGGRLSIAIGVTGGLSGEIIYRFPRETTLEMVKIMSGGMEFPEVDDFVTSAVGEIANIISGKAMIVLSEKDISCDILPPKILTEDEAREPAPDARDLNTQIHSPIGDIGLDIRLAAQS